jgi:hypothetical protein
MSEVNIINKYINELATANHQKFVAQDEAETLRNELAQKDSVIAALRQEAEQRDAANVEAPKQVDIIQGDIVES